VPAPIEKCPTCGERIPPSVGECLFCPPTAAETPSSPSAAPPAPASPQAAAPPPPIPAAPAAAPPPASVAPPAAPRPPSPIPAAAAAPALHAPHAARGFGLLLFEAEESLARGQVEKAVVLASRAAREQPGNLTARALYERTRRELLRGRRRE
jgi:hypothetical protein